MWWWRKREAASSPRIGLEQQLLAVTKEDIEKVTASDVEQLVQSLNFSEVQQAAEALLNYQRFPDVMHCTIPSVFHNALKETNEPLRQVLRPLLGGQLSFLYSIVPFIPAAYLRAEIPEHASHWK